MYHDSYPKNCSFKIVSPKNHPFTRWPGSATDVTWTNLTSCDLNWWKSFTYTLVRRRKFIFIECIAEEVSGRLGYVADFKCKRCLDGDSDPVGLLTEVELEPGVKVECVSKFCYLGDTLGSGGGVVEAARARVRCAWAKFKELSPILTVRGASYRIKGRIYSACVQSVLIYGTETWAMKASRFQRLFPNPSWLVRGRGGKAWHEAAWFASPIFKDMWRDLIWGKRLTLATKNLLQLSQGYIQLPYGD